MTNMERAQMRVKLANLRQRELQLSAKIDELCTVIRANLNTLLTAKAELKIPETAGLMDDLVMAWGELTAAVSEIARLENELE